MSQHQAPSDQRICPNCRGGNPPQARNCMWCGSLLYQGGTGAPPPAQPQPPVQVVVQGQRRSAAGPLLVLVLVMLCLLAGVIALAGAGNSSRVPAVTSGSGTGSSVNTTPAPIRDGPSYAEYNGNHDTMTDAQWAEYIKTLDGTRITDWSGWVYDVVRDTDTVYDLKVDFDGPDEAFASPEVIIKIPAADARQYDKHRKVVFSGIIDHIDCAIGICDVIVRDASVQQQ